MRKILSTTLLTIFLSTMIIFCVNADDGLTDQENAAFITRDEFNIWVNQFTASLSQLDVNATNRIYKDMDFYDMQYRFTERYKTSEYLNDDGSETPKLKRMIAMEKAKRGLS